MPRSATWGRRNSNNNRALIPQRRPCAAEVGAFSCPAAAPQTRALRCHRQQAKCPCKESPQARQSSLFWWWRTSLYWNSTTQQMQLSQQVNAQQGRDLQCFRGKTTTPRQQSNHTFGCMIWSTCPISEREVGGGLRVRPWSGRAHPKQEKENAGELRKPCAVEWKPVFNGFQSRGCPPEA